MNWFLFILLRTTTANYIEVLYHTTIKIKVVVHKIKSLENKIFSMISRHEMISIVVYYKRKNVIYTKEIFRVSVER